MVAVLSGCTPEPEPTPTPTAAFASEEEAFAAAEEVYAAYVSALNAVDFSTPGSFESVYSLLTGDAESSVRKSFSEFHAEGVSVSGTTEYEMFTGASFDSSSVVANVCLDVTNVVVSDSSGESLVSPDRPNKQPMSITFSVGGQDRLLISSMMASDELSCTS